MCYFKINLKVNYFPLKLIIIFYVLEGLFILVSCMHSYIVCIDCLHLAFPFSFTTLSANTHDTFLGFLVATHQNH